MEGTVFYSCLELPILEKLEVLSPSTKVICVGGDSFHGHKEPRTLNLKLQTSYFKISNLKFHQIWQLWVAIVFRKCYELIDSSCLILGNAL